MLPNITSLFAPQEGTTNITPPGQGGGYWVGAPSIIYVQDRRKYYLYYRIRRPRPIRGGEVRIAESTDGITFTDIWSCKKEALNTTSIERSALVACPDGLFRLYISYVDPADGRWRTDLLEAQDPEDLKPSEARKVFTAADIRAEGVKDPWVRVIDGTYYMILSYAPSLEHAPGNVHAKMHETHDVYNTGLTKSSTGLALSRDGRTFEWQGDVFAPGESGWDCYASRIGCVLFTPGVFTAFYDGSASVSENYEERTGIAVSTDLKHFQRVSTSGPVLTSPHGTGSLRYLDAVQVGDALRFYYEYVREDGSHELRMNQVTMHGAQVV